MEIDADPEPLGTLRGHVARANPVWQDPAPHLDALVIFAGPQLYVTPSWYPTKQESGKVVPTWNYAVVHAHGPLRPIDDPAWLRAFVTRLTARHEGERAAPWHVTDAPADFIERQLAGIVGIEIPVRQLDGKWKVSQNRTSADRAGVVAGLRERGAPDSDAMADLVASADVPPPRAPG
jgi:transcriptional regulator